ncbi:hypothetical protein NPIL_266931 [Nephila pilipes]|uniref:Uncharacterized protein n=1 Tax=Nephila pilipes TaxID=299642 RepID=A0A8X6UB90_NEPPI|nr:hypothetical protein NPIL_266931 [Nephila pilipes]
MIHDEHNHSLTLNTKATQDCVQRFRRQFEQPRPSPRCNTWHLSVNNYGKGRGSSSWRASIPHLAASRSQLTVQSDLFQQYTIRCSYNKGFEHRLNYTSPPSRDWGYPKYTLSADSSE